MLRNDLVNSLKGYPPYILSWLCDDDYDQADSVGKMFRRDNSISATTIIKPIRQILLDINYYDKIEQEVNAKALLAASMGKSIHSSIENSFRNYYKEVCRINGYSENIIDKIEINPKELKEGIIPIYQENRFFKEINNTIVNGKVDLIFDNQLIDIKTTSTYSYTSGSNYNKYQLQGSIYRWLVPEIITNEEMKILFVFTNWSEKMSKVNTSYPQLGIMEQVIPLLSIEETEEYLTNKINLIREYLDKEETSYPECTDEELWKGDDVWKIYKNYDSTRATRVFDNELDAVEYKIQKGGVFKHFVGKYKACNYCPFSSVCSQYKRLEEEDLIDKLV